MRASSNDAKLLIPINQNDRSILSASRFRDSVCYSEAYTAERYVIGWLAKFTVSSSIHRDRHARANLETGLKCATAFSSSSVLPPPTKTNLNARTLIESSAWQVGHCVPINFPIEEAQPDAALFLV
jgi:hypothetical protein